MGSSKLRDDGKTLTNMVAIVAVPVVPLGGRFVGAGRHSRTSMPFLSCAKGATRRPQFSTMDTRRLTVPTVCIEAPGILLAGQSSLGGGPVYQNGVGGVFGPFWRFSTGPLGRLFQSPADLMDRPLNGQTALAHRPRTGDVSTCISLHAAAPCSY